MIQHAPIEYIQTPRTTYGTVTRISTILDARMKDFILSRRVFAKKGWK